MTEKKVMTVGELLAWAYEETQAADSLELMKASLPAEIIPVINKQIQIRRERSRWLDEQVENALNLADDSAESGG